MELELEREREWEWEREHGLAVDDQPSSGATHLDRIPHQKLFNLKSKRYNLCLKKNERKTEKYIYIIP